MHTFFRSTLILSFLSFALTITTVTTALTAPLSLRADDSDAESAPQSIADQLATIQRDIAWLERNTAKKKAELQQAKQTGAKDEITDTADEVSGLEKRLQREKINFVALATGVELTVPELENNQNKKRDIIQELQQLLEPLLDAIHRVSEKPRRIEYFKSKIATLSDQVSMMNKAMTNLDLAIQQKKFPTLEAQLIASKDSLVHDRDEAQVRLNSLERQLNREMGDHRTVVQVVTESVRGFFAAKGKNLVIATLVFIAVFWGLLFFKRYLFSSKIIERMGMIAKPLQMVYGILSGILAMMAVILTLHFLNDWFLVTSLILFLLAFAWSSKAVITHFIAETKLALNLGPVKQGERVMWQGLPWLVKSLGFRSVLENESLEGGTVMLPASALTGMLSRMQGDKEIWFPTRVGDHVYLDDKTYGKVESQTPEMVILNIDGCLKHYSTLVFLAKNPQNFSRGFKISDEIIVNHAIPTAAFSVFNQSFAGLAKSKWNAEGISDFVVSIYPYTFEGKECVNLFMSVQCEGRLASPRDALRREMLQIMGALIDETRKAVS